jgi:hypothetical protein
VQATDKEIQAVLLCLLQAGLWGQGDLAIKVPISSGAWAAVYRAAKKHTIEGLVFDGIQQLPIDLMPPRDLLLKWTVRIDQIERHNLQMASCLKAMSTLFQRGGLSPILLKGHGVAACYDKPEHRVSGDIDWYFEGKSGYDEANQLIRTHGLNLDYVAGDSAEYCWAGLVVEHHKRMFDIHNPFCYGYLQRLKKQFQKNSYLKQCLGNELTLPAPMLMIVQVNAHILKHLLAFGLGVRQLCDSARLYYTFQAELDGAKLQEIYSKLGILRWIHLLHAVLVKYIGLPAQALPFPVPAGTAADWMFEEIWQSGNFGFHDERFKDQHVKSELRRNQAGQRVWLNVKRYFKYAPMEAISFPVVQYISKVKAKVL